MTAVLKDDTELFKQFSDNESFRRWLTDTVFALTYEQPKGKQGSASIGLLKPSDQVVLHWGCRTG